MQCEDLRCPIIGKGYKMFLYPLFRSLMFCHRFRGLKDKAPHFGCGDCGFESHRNHRFNFFWGFWSDVACFLFGSLIAFFLLARSNKREQ